MDTDKENSGIEREDETLKPPLNASAPKADNTPLLVELKQTKSEKYETGLIMSLPLLCL